MTADRIPCVVPFCRRTAPRAKFPDASEIICGKHWRMARKSRRRIYSMMLRNERDGILNERQRRLGWRLWEAIKAEVLTAAAP